MQAAGVLVSRSVGATREYEFNPQYAARRELSQLLERALQLYPSDLRQLLTIARSRHRRKGKPS